VSKLKRIMKPNQQFINMVSALFQNKQKSITQADITKHNNHNVTFYSISHARFVNMQMINKTEAFSDQLLIEIERNATRIIIGTDREEKIYRKLSDLQLSYHNGQGLLHWTVANENDEVFTVVKLLATDGTPQIKVISADTTIQIIHNVCELPNR
ncbi:MAG: hypothetical protein JWP44_4985, partial [Mucilaginibacter sp.]|nr:hypothetical protein [Mucilaginibacter sp.]